MKKLILGLSVFFAGFLGVLAIWCISIFEPWIYNGIDGFSGFLLGSGTTPIFVLCCILALGGLLLAAADAFLGEK